MGGTNAAAAAAAAAAADDEDDDSDSEADKLEKGEKGGVWMMGWGEAVCVFPRIVL